MEKVGVILKDLSPSQTGYISIGYLNSLCSVSNKFDPIVFCENITPPSSKINFAVMDISEIASFDGILISTTLTNTKSMIKAVNSAQKVFYVTYLEWLKNKDFINNMEIYRNQKITLIAPSLEYAKAIKNYSNRMPDAIIPGFNIPAIIKYINQKNEHRRSSEVIL